jgi:hypothetical protein
VYHVGQYSILNECTVLFRGSVLPVCHNVGVAICSLGGNLGKNHFLIQHGNCMSTSIYQEGV